MRWLIAAGLSGSLAAAGWFVSMHHDDWRWPLFFWGVAVGLAGAAVIRLVFVVVVRRQVLAQEQQAVFRRRLVIYDCCWLGAGLFFGAISAALNQPWIDFGVTLYAAVTLLLGMLLIARRFQR